MVRVRTWKPEPTLIALGRSEKRDASTPFTAMCSVHGALSLALALAPTHSMSLGSVCGIRMTSPGQGQGSGSGSGLG